MVHSLAVIINFCSIEARFLPFCVREAKKFASQIIVPVCDHFFDGTPERKDLLEETFLQLDSAQIISYPYLPFLLQETDHNKNHLWHSISRLVGFCELEQDIEYVLFLDADEIVEGTPFSLWLDSQEYRQYAACRLWNFWYFREEEYQAKTWETSPVLAQKKRITKKGLFQKGERDALFSSIKGNKKRGVPKRPLVHHYSWVRTQEEMLQKVHSWGHKEERNWKDLVEKEFQGPFRGTDFVHGYEYEKVKPFFQKALFEKKPFSQKRLSERDLLKILPGFFFKRLFSLGKKRKIA